MLAPDKIIKEIRVTEKATVLSSELNQYTFEVFPTHNGKVINKKEIAHAVEKVFGVGVVRVNIINKKPKLKRSRTQRGKFGSAPKLRKAIVTLKQGDTIEMV